MTNSDDLRKYLVSRMAEVLSLRELDNTPAVHEAAVRRLSELLDQVCDGDMVFPTLLPTGDGGIYASWHAAQYMIHIVVKQDGDGWFSFARPRERPVDEPLTDQSIEEARHRLRELSDFVEQHNPQWRTLFHV